MNREPHEYPRRILVAVTGLTPQVVTETLYALMRQEPPFVPTEVRLITTREGAERARLALLSEEPGWFRRFCQDYRIEGLRFDGRSIRILDDGDGRVLDDIRSPADNQRAADLITETIRELTSDPDSALHASIAGGRKTMGYYLGYALSLFGRPQDRLSHVLVSEPFESSWEFFYPTPYERVIPVKGEKLANCQDAEVTLAEIPFVRLRHGLPKRLLAGGYSFSEAIAYASRGIGPARLVISLRDKKVTASGETIDLGLTELAFLYWFARRTLRGRPQIRWRQREDAEEFLRYATTIFDPEGHEFERLRRSVEGRLQDRKLLSEYFEPQKTRLNQKLVEALGDLAARRYQIQRAGPRGDSHYFLPLQPDEIEIKR